MIQSIGSTEIFMPLLDEGTDVWRPVRAQHVTGDVYRVIGDAPDPEHELWQFLPDTLVRCREQRLSGGACLVAVEAAGSTTASESRDATPTI